MRIKKILLAVGGVFALALAVVLGLAATKPSTLHVERKATLSAPPEAVFPHIDDFHRWVAWSPWEKLDPSMSKTYSEPSRGAGATYAWSGNRNIGAGKMTVLESRPNEQISIRLEFFKPFASTNSAVFMLKPAAGGTEVTWAMDGPNNFMGKVMSVFIDMDAMIGENFATGLAELGRVSERGALASAK